MLVLAMRAMPAHEPPTVVAEKDGEFPDLHPDSLPRWLRQAIAETVDFAGEGAHLQKKRAGTPRCRPLRRDAADGVFTCS